MKLLEAAWPREQSAEAIAAIARDAGWPLRDGRLSQTTDLAHCASWLGLEAEPVDVAYEDVDRFVRSMRMAVLDLGSKGIVAVAETTPRRCTLLLPDGSQSHVPPSTLRAALVATIESERSPFVDEILRAVPVPQRRLARARRALLERSLASTRIGGVTLLRLGQPAPFSAHVKATRLGRRAQWILWAHALRNLLLVLGWWLIGRAALDGRTDAGLLSGWALVIVTQIPLTVCESWLQGVLAIDAGALFKKRMLAGQLSGGALSGRRDDLRREGAGHLLGRVLEADAVEGLALGAGVAVATSIEELAVAIVVIVGFGTHIATGGALFAWTFLTIAEAIRYARRRAEWTTARLDMTHDLVERMVGHRTRLAQQAPEHWHDGEDELLARYVGRSNALDRTVARLWAAIPRGWLVIALASFVPALADHARAGTPQLAVTLGASLLGYRALRKLLMALASAAGAVVAWDKARPLFSATLGAHSQRDVAEAPPTPEPLTLPEATGVRLEATGITYRYGPREPVIRDGSLVVHEGERLLLLGQSGAGKSTLAAVLSGLREADAGLVTIGGLDRKTLGLAGFRRYVVAAPQFHDNFLLGSTLAFNLLMGASWPASEDDLAAAEALCRDLGLGPLLDRMPSGLQTQVGETGWQLSHGERSRVYLARAILQKPRVLVLDESFGALDPATLERAMSRVLRERAAVIVIAHP